MDQTTPPTELGHSPDAHAQRQAELLRLIRQTAPEVMSDQHIDWDKLRDLLGQEQLAPAPEHYELLWAGKTAARREIQITSTHTLRPDPHNPLSAPHMLIEGENLEVLRVLQKSYYGKVKMIYIDPPYNTGNDSFVYPDDYSETLAEYQLRTGEKNAAGYLNKQSLWKKNSKESGHYHSAWLSMMYPRLYLARNLLRDDGVIFISIDDNEAANLKLLCDEVFGPENFVADFIWQHRKSSQNDVDVSLSHNHTLCFSRNRYKFRLNSLSIDNEKFDNPDADPRGPWVPDPLDAPNIRPNLMYPIFNPITGDEHLPPSGRHWRFSKDKFAQILADERIVFGKNGKGRPQFKRFLSEAQEKGTNPFTVWTDHGTATEGTKELMKIFGGKKIFDTPKPTRLINSILKLSVAGDGIVLDFFAGSGTTAHAVMALNLEDGGHRQCISVQMPELLDPDTEAYKAGYRTIADITRARIGKVIEQLKAEHPDKTQELACAHFTLAPSNFKVWQSDALDAQALRDQLVLFKKTEQGDAAQACAAQQAMLAELLLKHGLGALGVHAISRPLVVAGGVTVHRVLMPDDRTMWLCFELCTAALKDAIVKARPAQVVMLHSCFVGDKADEQLANLQLELAGLDIGLTVV
jgi:adenine-specific DNA-methyltransferase